MQPYVRVFASIAEPVQRQKLRSGLYECDFSPSMTYTAIAQCGCLGEVAITRLLSEETDLNVRHRENYELTRSETRPAM